METGQQYQVDHLYQSRFWSNELADPNSSFIFEELQHESNPIHFLITKKKFKGLPYSSMKITFGPVLDYNNTFLLDMALKRIKQIAKQHKAVFVQANPFTWGSNTENVKATFLKNGFLRTNHYIYEATMMLDLTKSEEDLFSQFENRGKEAIRQSQRRGITTSKVEINDDNFDLFYAMYSGTCARTAMIPEPYEKVKKLLFHFGKQSLAFLFFAFFESKPVCAFVAFKCGDCLSLIYQGTDYNNDNQNKRPANGLYWGTLKWAKEQGYKWFDLAGVSTNPLPGSKSEGIRLYKRQFGGDYMEFPGNFEYVNRPILKKLIDIVLPLYSKFALRKARKKNNLIIFQVFFLMV